MSIGGTPQSEVIRYLQLIAGLLIGLIIFIAVLVTIGFIDEAKKTLLFEKIDNNTKISGERSGNATLERSVILDAVKSVNETVNSKLMTNVTITNLTAS